MHTGLLSGAPSKGCRPPTYRCGWRDRYPAARQYVHPLGVDPLKPGLASRYVGFRHTDLLASGSTSLLLYLYTDLRGISRGSVRDHQIAILAHGTTTIGMATTASVASVIHSAKLMRLAGRRSQVNYVSAGLLLKNFMQLTRMSGQAREVSYATEAKSDESVARIARSSQFRTWMESSGPQKHTKL